MRKALIILVVLFVISLGAGVWVWSDIDRVDDEVIIEENVRYGDMAAAEGLSMDIHTLYDYNLFWDTHFESGQSGLQQSSFLATAKKNYDFGEPYYSGIELHSMLNYFRDVEELGPDCTGLDKAFYELYQQLEPSGYSEKTIWLKDYMDYYPIGGNLSMPGVDMFFEGDEEFWGEVNSSEVHKQLNEYFKIPVLENEDYWISLGLDENGRINTRGNGTADKGGVMGETNSYDLYTDSVIMPDAIYFTINNRTAVDGVLADTSLIPGGYGIYRIPYSLTDGVVNVDFDSLSTVKQLDEQFHTVYIMSDEAQEKLIVVGDTNDRLSMLVIDAATMETEQDIELDTGDELHCWQYERGEGFFMFYLKDNRMALVERQPSGEYLLRFTIHDIAAEEMYNRYNISDVAWNGEKLALCGFKSFGDRDWRYVADFYYAVYDETGLVCFVDCDSSLSVNGDDEWGGVTGRDYEGIVLSWK